MKLGEFELCAISDGHFWLDGGSMFGVVPKVLWNKVSPADRHNRIRLALNCLLVRSKEKSLLIDTGIGEKFSRRSKEIYKLERSTDLISSLAQHEVNPEDIDYVINTHLHFDHCGGNTTNSGGKYVPTFPNAKYVIQRQEWFSAQNTDEKTKSSYRASDFMPLEEAGQIQFVDGDDDIIPGIRVLLTNGHTLGHQSVLISSGKNAALYLGDLIPTSYHLRPHYLTGFDLYPVDLILRKKAIVESAVNAKHVLIFEHDPNVIFARLEGTKGAVKLVPIKGQKSVGSKRRSKKVSRVGKPRSKRRQSR